MTGVEDSALELEEQYVIDASYVVFLFGIVVLTVINSILWVVLRDPDIRRTVFVINIGLSVVLLGDAFMQLNRRRKGQIRQFGRRYGWLVFVGSLPVPFFGLARLVYLGLGVRRIRGADLAEAREVIITKRAQSTLLFIVLLVIIVYEIAVLMIISVEGGNPAANIRTTGDALWWGLVTLSTVGYGDQYPVSGPGRVIGAALIIVGVALFTSVTSFMADWFRRPRHSTPPITSVTLAASTDPLATLEAMRRTLEDQNQAHQTAMATLQAQLDEIQRAMDRG